MFTVESRSTKLIPAGEELRIWGGIVSFDGDRRSRLCRSEFQKLVSRISDQFVGISGKRSSLSYYL